MDVIGSVIIRGEGEFIANEIRQRVKDELGITAYVGVADNKIFAKLGSDMKKPDATTIITRQNYKEKVWSLPAEDLLYVGRSTKHKLYQVNIITIGVTSRKAILACFMPTWANGVMYFGPSPMD